MASSGGAHRRSGPAPVREGGVPFLQPLLRHRLLFVLALGGVALAFVAAVSLTEPWYEATATLQTSTLRIVTQDEQVIELLPSGSGARAEARFIANPAFLGGPLREAGLEIDRADVPERVTVDPDAGRNTIDVTVTARSPDVAAAAANAIAETFVDLRRREVSDRVAALRQQVEQQLAGSDDSTGERRERLTVLAQELDVLAETVPSSYAIEPAGTPSSPSFPDIVRTAQFGLLLGVFFGLGLVFVVDRRRVHHPSAERIAALLDVPLLALFEAPGWAGPAGVRDYSAGFRGRRRDLLDPFVRLESRLARARERDEWRTVLVTGVDSPVAAPLVAADLALIAARHRSSVLAVDTVRQRLSLGSLLLPEQPLLDPLAEREVAGSPLGPVAVDVRAYFPEEEAPLATPTAPPVRLDCLCLGAGAESTGRPGQARLRPGLAPLRASYDLILLTGPPLTGVGEDRALLAEVDAVLLVADRSQLELPQIRAGAARLRSLEKPVLGVVVYQH